MSFFCVFVLNQLRMYNIFHKFSFDMDTTFSTLLYVLVYASVEPSANAANILGVFTNHAASHFNYHHAIMQSLADAGHRITFLSPFSPAKPASNFRYVTTGMTATEANHTGSATDFKNMSWQQFIETIVNVLETECYDLVNIAEVQNLLNSPTEKYDIMFVETVLMYECYLPIAHKFDVPVIGTLAFRPWFSLDLAQGDPHSVIHPFLISSKPVRMSFYERLRNVMDHLQLHYYTYKKIVSPKLRKFYDLHYPDYDTNWNQNISFLFTNWDSTFLPRATIPTVAGIAGIHIQPAKSLPQNIQEFIDGAENGVILFTIGSYTSTTTLDAKLKSLFVDVFARLPQRVIWKFDHEIHNLPDNILLLKWVPQRDILAHKNVKAFITHTGINGAYEAIYEATPMIMMPLFGDQLSNAAILAELGVGERLVIQDLTEEVLLNTIHKVVNDPSYGERIRALSRAFKDRPLSAQQTVVYWTEYVLRHNGTAHLRPAAADMPLYSYLLLDIILFVAICATSIFFLLYRMIKKIYFYFRRNENTTVKCVKID